MTEFIPIEGTNKVKCSLCGVTIMKRSVKRHESTKKHRAHISVSDDSYSDCESTCSVKSRDIVRSWDYEGIWYP